MFLGFHVLGFYRLANLVGRISGSFGDLVGKPSAYLPELK